MKEPGPEERALAAVEGLPDDGRLAAFLTHLEEQDERERAALLNAFLASPEKWHRDLAAAAANELGIDPLAVDEEPTAPPDAAPVLHLGFDEDGPGSTPPGGPGEGPDDAPPILILGTSDSTAPEGPEVRPGIGTVRPVFRLLAVGLIIGIGAYLLLAVPDSERRATEAETCKQQRRVLDEALVAYRTLRGEPSGERFLRSSGFQARLIEAGVLAEELRCPTISRRTSFGLVGGAERVRCFEHGAAR